jgi:aminoglycoside phosphotransferase (APT) family kinase protein
VEDQFLLYRDLPIEAVPTRGKVNAVFKTWFDLAGRFPLQANDPAEARARLTAEADAAREFTAGSTVAAPAPVAMGEPGDEYPMPWSIQTWLPGHDATVENPGDSAEFAHDIAALIASLRMADTRGRRFNGSGRGGHLRAHDDWLHLCFVRSHGLLDVPRLRGIWTTLRTLPRRDDEAMCHGDLTPPNVLLRQGRLVGVLDSGSFGPADPALDLVAAWHLLGDNHRDTVRTSAGRSDVQWLRGAAWAFEQAMGLVWYYADSNPEMSRWGRRTLDRIIRASAE